MSHNNQKRRGSSHANSYSNNNSNNNNHSKNNKNYDRYDNNTSNKYDNFNQDGYYSNRYYDDDYRGYAGDYRGYTDDYRSYTDDYRHYEDGYNNYNSYSQSQSRDRNYRNSYDSYDYNTNNYQSTSDQLDQPPLTNTSSPSSVSPDKNPKTMKAPPQSKNGHAKSTNNTRINNASTANSPNTPSANTSRNEGTTTPSRKVISTLAHDIQTTDPILSTTASNDPTVMNMTGLPIQPAMNLPFAQPPLAQSTMGIPLPLGQPGFTPPMVDLQQPQTMNIPIHMFVQMQQQLIMYQQMQLAQHMANNTNNISNNNAIPNTIPIANTYTLQPTATTQAMPDVKKSDEVKDGVEDIDAMNKIIELRKGALAAQGKEILAIGERKDISQEERWLLQKQCVLKHIKQRITDGIETDTDKSRMTSVVTEIADLKGLIEENKRQEKAMAVTSTEMNDKDNKSSKPPTIDDTSNQPKNVKSTSNSNRATISATPCSPSLPNPQAATTTTNNTDKSSETAVITHKNPTQPSENAKSANEIASRRTKSKKAEENELNLLSNTNLNEEEKRRSRDEIVLKHATNRVNFGVGDSADFVLVAKCAATRAAATYLTGGLNATAQIALAEVDRLVAAAPKPDNSASWTQLINAQRLLKETLEIPSKLTKAPTPINPKLSLFEQYKRYIITSLQEQKEEINQIKAAKKSREWVDLQRSILRCFILQRFEDGFVLKSDLSAAQGRGPISEYITEGRLALAKNRYNALSVEQRGALDQLVNNMESTATTLVAIPIPQLVTPPIKPAVSPIIVEKLVDQNLNARAVATTSSTTTTTTKPDQPPISWTEYQKYITISCSEQSRDVAKISSTSDWNDEYQKIEHDFSVKRINRGFPLGYDISSSKIKHLVGERRLSQVKCDAACLRYAQLTKDQRDDLKSIVYKYPTNPPTFFDRYKHRMISSIHFSVKDVEERVTKVLHRKQHFITNYHAVVAVQHRIQHGCVTTSDVAIIKAGFSDQRPNLKHLCDSALERYRQLTAEQRDDIDETASEILQIGYPSQHFYQFKRHLLKSFHSQMALVAGIASAPKSPDWNERSRKIGADCAAQRIRKGFAISSDFDSLPARSTISQSALISAKERLQGLSEDECRYFQDMKDNIVKINGQMPSFRYYKEYIIMSYQIQKENYYKKIASFASDQERCCLFKSTHAADGSVIRVQQGFPSQADLNTVSDQKLVGFGKRVSKNQYDFAKKRFESLSVENREKIDTIRFDLNDDAPEPAPYQPTTGIRPREDPYDGEITTSESDGDDDNNNNNNNNNVMKDGPNDGKKNKQLLKSDEPKRQKLNSISQNGGDQFVQLNPSSTMASSLHNPSITTNTTNTTSSSSPSTTLKNGNDGSLPYKPSSWSEYPSQLQDLTSPGGHEWIKLLEEQFSTNFLPCDLFTQYLGNLITPTNLQNQLPSNPNNIAITPFLPFTPDACRFQSDLKQDRANLEGFMAEGIYPSLGFIINPAYVPSPSLPLNSTPATPSKSPRKGKKNTPSKSNRSDNNQSTTTTTTTIMSPYPNNQKYIPHQNADLNLAFTAISTAPNTLNEQLIHNSKEYHTFYADYKSKCQEKKIMLCPILDFKNFAKYNTNPSKSKNVCSDALCELEIKLLSLHHQQLSLLYEFKVITAALATLSLSPPPSRPLKSSTNSTSLGSYHMTGDDSQDDDDNDTPYVLGPDGHIIGIKRETSYFMEQPYPTHPFEAFSHFNPTSSLLQMDDDDSLPPLLRIVEPTSSTFMLDMSDDESHKDSKKVIAKIKEQTLTIASPMTSSSSIVLPAPVPTTSTSPASNPIETKPAPTTTTTSTSSSSQAPQSSSLSILSTPKKAVKTQPTTTTTTTPFSPSNVSATQLDDDKDDKDQSPLPGTYPIRLSIAESYLLPTTTDFPSLGSRNNDYPFETNHGSTRALNSALEVGIGSIGPVYYQEFSQFALTLSPAQYPPSAWVQSHAKHFTTIDPPFRALIQDPLSDDHQQTKRKLITSLANNELWIHYYHIITTSIENAQQSLSLSIKELSTLLNYPSLAELYDAMSSIQRDQLPSLTILNKKGSLSSNEANDALNLEANLIIQHHTLAILNPLKDFVNGLLCQSWIENHWLSPSNNSIPFLDRKPIHLTQVAAPLTRREWNDTLNHLASYGLSLPRSIKLLNEAIQNPLDPRYNFSPYEPSVNEWKEKVTKFTAFSNITPSPRSLAKNSFPKTVEEFDVMYKAITVPLKVARSAYVSLFRWYIIALSGVMDYQGVMNELLTNTTVTVFKNTADETIDLKHRLITLNIPEAFVLSRHAIESIEFIHIESAFTVAYTVYMALSRSYRNLCNTFCITLSRESTLLRDEEGCFPSLRLGSISALPPSAL